MSSDESKNKNIRRKEKVKVLLLDTEKLVYYLRFSNSFLYISSKFLHTFMKIRHVQIYT